MSKECPFPSVTGRNMNAEIIAVGSELLTPKRVDTNSLYLTDQLNALGVEVVTKSVLGDDRERLAAAIALAASRSQIVILTGGLGPTEDDVTRDAAAQALGRGQTLREEIAEHIRQLFEQRQRKMAEINRRQAYVLDGAEILPNDRGTAPGQWLEHNGSCIVLLPGPPHELEAMFIKQCLPRLQRVAPKLAIRTLIMRVAGMPESDLDQLIAPAYKKYENPVTTILAAAGDIQIHLRARSETLEEASALIEEVRRPIEDLLGDRIYSWDGEPIEVIVGRMLRERRATVTVAESCTGGLLSEKITSVPGSSAYFVGGFVTYSNRAKIDWIGVPESVINQYGAVSKETAEALAVALRRHTGASYALSITGVAGPDADDAPKGTVYTGIADARGVAVVHRQFLGDRARVRSFAAQMALDLLRRRMLS